MILVSTSLLYNMVPMNETLMKPIYIVFYYLLEMYMLKFKKIAIFYA